MKAIGIFPASGGLGESTFHRLLPHYNPDEQGKIVLISRHPDKLNVQLGEAEPFVEVEKRQASYESSPSDLEAAFAGVGVLFLISYPSHVCDYRVKVQLPTIDAAHRAGVQYIVYSSLAFAGDTLSDTSLAEVMQAHLATERHLRQLAASDASFSYTVLRMGLYSESTPIYTAFFDPKQARQQSPDTIEILIPHDGTGPGIAWAKRDELGEATGWFLFAYAYREPAAGEAFPFRNETVLLSGPTVWSLEETVRVLGEIAGREVRIRQVQMDEYVALPRVQDVFRSEEKARTWATAWDAIRAGETAVGGARSKLGDILGREPEEFDVTARRYWA
ncbi:hypothetical protein B0T22DRAFT_378680 [Podospora appendiculata]|uniref:NmrA-like domain-containing protein n=1 Tax=Podospora appendiculata TaxID=314037 RepID=A0AAE0XA78_9PEZI|nr:hypothetical protein B0T22DRAFT_378680 [Podospora appendiculata]